MPGRAALRGGRATAARAGYAHRVRPSLAPSPSLSPARVPVLLALALALALGACGRAPTTSQAEPPAPTAASLAPVAPPKTAPPAPAPAPPPAPRAIPGGGAVVGLSGLAAWGALSPAERDRVKRAPILYLHQSVGQDLEDGCEANGFKFEYFGPDTRTLASGPNGGIFTDVGNVPNGEPFKKFDVVRRSLKVTGGAAKIVSFSFGYADVRDEDLAKVQAEYARLVRDVKAQGARFVHITPPLVYSVAENPPKQRLRAYMLATFKDDVIFDLQDVESLDGGKRCEEGGVWRICQANRSTPGCASKGQGIDGDGAGHLCERKARELAKGLLYAFYLAGA